MKRKNNLKLPNGFGSIIYLGGNRRKPYGALKTVGWNENGNAIREYVGYADSWNNAYKLLLEYNDNPYDLNLKNITLEEVFDKLELKLLEDLENGKISKSSYSCLKSSYSQHLSKLKNKSIFEIKRKDIQSLIDTSKLKYTGRNYIKILFTRIVNFCIDELELNLDTSLYLKLDIGEKEKSDKHIPFKTDEIEEIEKLAEYNDLAKMIMIYLYTGLRPSELLGIHKSNVFLNNNYMVGGIKTEAGKNRLIPIHSKIKKYIQYFYDKSNGEFLIINEKSNKKFTYDSYRDKFDNLMNQLTFKHTPHDTRHTFATKCDECGIETNIIKILLGHSLASDVTLDVYIHKNAESLRKEVEKITY